MKLRKKISQRNMKLRKRISQRNMKLRTMNSSLKLRLKTPVPALVLALTASRNDRITKEWIHKPTQLYKNITQIYVI